MVGETRFDGFEAVTSQVVSPQQKRYRTEMSRPDARRILDLLAALSHTCDFSVGCYCQDERRCHRSALRELLVERSARIV